MLAGPRATRPAVGAGLLHSRDALRTNDTRLVAAALGPYAAAHLDGHGWRQGVVKCVFMGVPLDAVADLDERADDELRAHGARLRRPSARRRARRCPPTRGALLSADQSATTSGSS